MPMIIDVYLSDDTIARLNKTAEQKQRSIKELCEAAIDEAALDAWRGRKDDPARAFSGPVQ